MTKVRIGDEGHNAITSGAPKQAFDSRRQVTARSSLKLIQDSLYFPNEPADRRLGRNNRQNLSSSSTLQQSWYSGVSKKNLLITNTTKNTNT